MLWTALIMEGDEINHLTRRPETRKKSNLLQLKPKWNETSIISTSWWRKCNFLSGFRFLSFGLRLNEAQKRVWGWTGEQEQILRCHIRPRVVTDVLRVLKINKPWFYDVLIFSPPLEDAVWVFPVRLLHDGVRIGMYSPGLYCKRDRCVHREAVKQEKAFYLKRCDVTWGAVQEMCSRLTGVVSLHARSAAALQFIFNREIRSGPGRCFTHMTLWYSGHYDFYHKTGF